MEAWGDYATRKGIRALSRSIFYDIHPQQRFLWCSFLNSMGKIQEEAEFSFPADELPTAAATKHHQLSGLKQHTRIILASLSQKSRRGLGAVCWVASVMSNSAIPWTVAHHQAPPSVGFSRQQYWSGLPCPPPGDLPDPWIKLTYLTSPALR